MPFTNDEIRNIARVTLDHYEMRHYRRPPLWRRFLRWFGL